MAMTIANMYEFDSLAQKQLHRQALSPNGFIVFEQSQPLASLPKSGTQHTIRCISQAPLPQNSGTKLDAFFVLRL